MNMTCFGTVYISSLLIAVSQVFRILREIYYLSLPSGDSLNKNGSSLKKKINWDNELFLQ